MSATAVLRAVVAELRVAGMLAMRYRASFLAETVMSFGWVAWTVIPLLVVYEYRADVQGWTRDQALLVVGLFITLEGLLGALVEPNLRAVVEQVRDGTFDYTLLKPIDTQLLVSIHRIQPTELPHALSGLVVVGVAASRLDPLPGPGDVAAAALLLVAGLMLLHGLWTIVVATSFWFVRVDNLSVLLRSLLDAGRWPVGYYRGVVRFVLTWVVPVGLITTFPAMALRGQLQPQLLLATCGVSLGFSLLARAVWRFALRHYTSASS
ncbi:MAG: ABC-2 family transporter protein [Planctomycetota bacterium]|nr:ABC-2 family transporter protein [Planctomycetota bacterium]